MTHEATDYGVSVRIAGEDSRYPVLVIEGDFGVRGYTICKNSGELDRICVCAAHSENECCCGAWDDVDD